MFIWIKALILKRIAFVTNSKVRHRPKWNSQNMCIFKKKKKPLWPLFMAPLWGSTASRLEPLRGGSLLFTTKFSEISGTHFIDLGRMKG